MSRIEKIIKTIKTSFLYCNDAGCDNYGACIKTFNEDAHVIDFTCPICKHAGKTEVKINTISFTIERVKIK